MTDARLSVTLPEYETELAATQRTAMRNAALLAAPLLVAFTLLDRAATPPFWLPLLGLRLAAASVLGLVARLTEKLSSAFPLTLISVAVICTTIEAGVFATGGAHSPYLTSNIAVLAGVGILVPLTAMQAAIVQLVGLGIALVPVLLRMQPGDGLPLITSASYLLAIAIVAVAGAHLQDTLRRREHRARTEVARQIGLINLGTLAGGLAHDMREVLIAMRQGARFAGGDLREVMLSHEVALALTLVTQRMRADGVALRREYAPDVPLVSCQPTLLGQVLVNLLINALDAMVERKDALLIVRIRSEPGFAFVEVEDNGPGIPPRLRTRIFEPFFSTKGESGNGLGLWISSEIARMHGGELVALSGEKGALFRLSFPIEASAPAAPKS